MCSSLLVLENLLAICGVCEESSQTHENTSPPGKPRISSGPLPAEKVVARLGCTHTCVDGSHARNGRERTRRYWAFLAVAGDEAKLLQGLRRAAVPV